MLPVISSKLGFNPVVTMKEIQMALQSTVIVREFTFRAISDSYSPSQCQVQYTIHFKIRVIEIHFSDVTVHYIYIYTYICIYIYTSIA